MPFNLAGCIVGNVQVKYYEPTKGGKPAWQCKCKCDGRWCHLLEADIYAAINNNIEAARHLHCGCLKKKRIAENANKKLEVKLENDKIHHELFHGRLSVEEKAIVDLINKTASPLVTLRAVIGYYVKMIYKTTAFCSKAPGENKAKEFSDAKRVIESEIGESKVVESEIDSVVEDDSKVEDDSLLNFGRPIRKK